MVIAPGYNKTIRMVVAALLSPRILDGTSGSFLNTHDFAAATLRRIVFSHALELSKALD